MTVDMAGGSEKGTRPTQGLWIGAGIGSQERHSPWEMELDPSFPSCLPQPGESGGAGQEQRETSQGAASAAGGSVTLQGRDVLGEVPEMWGTGW